MISELFVFSFWLFSSFVPGPFGSLLVPFGSCSCSLWLLFLLVLFLFGPRSWWLLVLLRLPSLVVFLFVFLWLLSEGTTKRLGTFPSQVSLALIFPLAPDPIHSCLLLPLPSHL
jgi:hypothetical protein